jgi:G3E family GTPase
VPLDEPGHDVEEFVLHLALDEMAAIWHHQLRAGDGVGELANANGHAPETEECGISSAAFRARRPMHPQRLHAALEQLQGVLRSKGFCWIASWPDIAAIWSQAGPNLSIEPAQYWSTAEVPAGQEIVFIGVNLARTRVLDLMQAALLTDAELGEGPQRWVDYTDPLPP